MNESKNFIFQLERVSMNKCPHLKQNFHKTFNKKFVLTKVFIYLHYFLLFLQDILCSQSGVYGESIIHILRK